MSKIDVYRIYNKESLLKYLIIGFLLGIIIFCIYYLIGID